MIIDGQEVEGILTAFCFIPLDLICRREWGWEVWFYFEEKQQRLMIKFEQEEHPTKEQLDQKSSELDSMLTETKKNQPTEEALLAEKVEQFKLTNTKVFDAIFLQGKTAAVIPGKITDGA